jgi:Nitroreductase family
MLDLIKSSFLLQHWEFVAIFISIAYFVVRLRENSHKGKPKDDNETIALDAESIDVDDGDLTPALENVKHRPYKGAQVTLSGGAQEFFNMVSDRRSVRKFSKKPVDIEIVKKCIAAAGTSPSGAHTEPWTFCLIKRFKKIAVAQSRICFITKKNC